MRKCRGLVFFGVQHILLLVGRRNPHCKDTAPKNYSQKGNCATSVLISTFIYVSVSDLYIPTIGLPYWLQQNILNILFYLVAEQQQRVRGSRSLLGRLCESVLVSLDLHSANHTRQNLRYSSLIIFVRYSIIDL